VAANEISGEFRSVNSAKQPLVSIVIPVFNGSDFLGDAIDSALAQTYKHVEVLVVNDGSTDGGATERIALSYGDRIRYYSKPNGHVASALNYGIARMGGEYFSWLSHDDMYHPHKIELQVRALERAGPCAVLYSDFEALDVLTGERRAVLQPGVPPAQFRWYLTIANTMHGCTLLLPRACFDECGMFDERLRTTQDYDMWFRIAARFPFIHVPGVVVTARQHPAQGSHQLRGFALEECNRLLAGFAQVLTDEELVDATGQSPAQSYATMAANLQARGFLQARDTALDLSRVRLAGEPFRTASAARLSIAGVRLTAAMQSLSGSGASLLHRFRKD